MRHNSETTGTVGDTICVCVLQNSKFITKRNSGRWRSVTNGDIIMHFELNTTYWQVRHLNRLTQPGVGKKGNFLIVLVPTIIYRFHIYAYATQFWSDQWPHPLINTYCKLLFVITVWMVVHLAHINIKSSFNSHFYRVKSSFSSTTTGLIWPPVTSTGNWTAFVADSTLPGTSAWRKTHTTTIMIAIITRQHGSTICR